MRRVLRWLAVSFVVSLVTTDLLVALAVTIAGAAVGYERAWDAAWTWRTQHPLWATAVAVASLAVVSLIRRRGSVRHLLHHHRNHTQAPNGALDSQAGACATGIPHGRNEQA